MKKFIYALLILITGILILPISVSAASAKIDLYTSSKNPMVGDSVTVTIYVTGAAPLGTYEYSLSYDKAKLMLTSGDVYNVGYPSDAKTKSFTKTFKFKVIATGSSTVTVKSASVYDYASEKECSLVIDPVSIKGTTQDELEATYSTNNFLKSLSIDGVSLEPTFDKNTLNYKVTLDPNIEKITVKATKEDNEASVKGAGEISVSEGDNKIEIVVTSQKGTKRTYTIIATVIDSNPVDVTIDDKKYQVVKKENNLTKPETYEKTEITINGITVPAFYSEITKYTLVGLKDNEGNIALYNYLEDGSFKLYQEIGFNNLKITLIKTNDIPTRYKKTQILINDLTVDAYKLTETSKYSLIYAMNIETGETAWYLYEESEHTIQKYYSEEIDDFVKKAKFTENIIYGLGAGIVILSFLLIIVASKKSKPRKIKKIELVNDEPKLEIKEEIIKPEEEFTSEAIEILDRTKKQEGLVNDEPNKKMKKKSLNKMLDDM